jgi:hypothetical protein
MTENNIQAIKGKLDKIKMTYLFSFNLPVKLTPDQTKTLKENLEYTLMYMFPKLKEIKP